jgi:hypothetical protein
MCLSQVGWLEPGLHDDGVPCCRFQKKKWKATIVANTQGTAGRQRKGQQVGFRGEKRELVQTRYLRGAKYIVRVVQKPT